jgi:nucleoside 2-deoxyribosyltransferase
VSFEPSGLIETAAFIAAIITRIEDREIRILTFVIAGLDPAIHAAATPAPDFSLRDEVLMTTAVCPIWNTPAELLEKAGDYEVFDSPRAGGKYWISGTASGAVLPLTDLAKRLLTTWLCEQRRAGVEIPRIQSDVLNIIRTRQSLSVPSRLTRSLQVLGNDIKELGSFLTLSSEWEQDTLRYLAETESKSFGELTELFDMLNKTGLVEGTFYLGGGVNAHPTALGWQEIDNLSRRPLVSPQAFVAMWFHGSTNDAYLKGIAPALSATGYKPVRIDKKEHNNKIDDEIVAEIRRSRFLVADFTCEPKNIRGGVYYEAGFAQGLGIPVIWSCKDASINDLHFDTRQYAHIVWKDPSDLFLQLKNRIGATIGDGPLPKS